MTPDEEKNDALQRDYVQKALPVVELMRGEERILAGSREIQQEVGRTPNGAMYTWLSPYLDSEGKLRAIISMSYSIEHIVKLILHAFLVDIVPFVISLSLGLLILLLLVRRRIVLPINAISDSMKRFAQDSSTRPEPLNIPKELPHNTAAHLAVPFPPVISCRFFDLPPVNLQNLQERLTKKSLAS